MKKSSLGSEIKSLRLHAGITQVELASAVGVASNYISRVELGGRNPSAKLLERISEATTGKKNHFNNIKLTVDSSRTFLRVDLKPLTEKEAKFICLVVDNIKNISFGRMRDFMAKVTQDASK